MQPWPALAEYRKDVSLTDLHVRVCTYQLGPPDAPARLLVHGLGDDADSWRHVAAALAQDQRVVALDLPGFGRSDKPDIAYSLPFYTRVIYNLVHSLALQQVTLIGSSMGAAICQALALQAPPWLRQLVLIDGGLLSKGQRINLNLLLFLIPVLGEYRYNRLRRSPEAAYATLAPYYANLQALPAAERAFLRQRVNERVWDDGQRRAYFSALRSLAANTSRQHGLAEQLGALSLPTTIIWGEQDQIIPLANGQALAQAQPGARLVIIPNSGHLPHQETPAAVLNAIQANSSA